ncbi:MAG: hypothetical protein HY903_08050 [Deltaproteobacteria bacterium]|nr:hypothetical protein [Deltaproteobacteria bacterium]
MGTITKLLFVVALGYGLSACANKGCDPKPMPAVWKEIAELLPPDARICGEVDGALRVFFKTITTASEGSALLGKLADGKGWTREPGAEGATSLTVTKGDKRVVATMVTYKNDLYADYELVPTE